MANFKKMLMSQLDNVEIEPQLRKIAEQLRENTMMFPSLTEEQYQEAVDHAVQSLNVTFGESYIVENTGQHKPWFAKYYKDLNHTRWDRYLDFLKNKKGYPPAVTNSMNENLFKIIDLVGNPNGENFEKKGLVVGDVQSGKTSNYIGLMNLATDAKYQIMIVLTGTTNTLREQTQIRIEEGLGKSNQNPVGVSAIKESNYKDFKEPVYLTSVASDFNKNSRAITSIGIEQTTVPIVIVTKKNTSSLEHIYSWLSEYSMKMNHDYIDSSLLLIDDEADFASIDTADPDKDPTTINSKIRQILKLFTKSSYIGFTATPFANVFIDPKSESQMYGQDLFPSDYIYILGESTEYVGVEKLFGSDDDKKNIVTIEPNEVETYLPLKHKKDHNFSNLAPSMKDAINAFLLSNTIRDLRGNEHSHRSMLFNISRFSALHEAIKVIVSEYLEDIKRDVRLYSKLEYNEALEYDSIKSLKITYDRHYTKLEDGYSFKDILSHLNNSIFRIKVTIVNKDNKGVDYLRNEEEGERIIVIGGFSLSRGVTLEGLLISYFWRNSMTYDTLLQMGRWFGYRAHYEDLTRVYMTSEVQSDFKFIAKATKELKNDLQLNADRGLTPREFGIKVRSGQTGLIITARNKMRTGEDITTKVDFNQDIVETLSININDKKINTKNIEVIKDLISSNKEFIHNSNKFNGLKNISKDKIIKLLEEYTQVQGSKFDNNLVRNWLVENESPILDSWDVAFVTGNHDLQFDYGSDLKGNTNLRTLIEANGLDGIYKTKNSRLGSPTDGTIGLDDEQIAMVKSEMEKIEGTSMIAAPKKTTTIPQRNYFDSSLNRKPILLVYSVVPKSDESEELLDTNYYPMITLGIPDLGKGKSKAVTYKVNRNYLEITNSEDGYDEL